MDWFLCDRELRHERVNLSHLSHTFVTYQRFQDLCHVLVISGLLLLAYSLLWMLNVLPTFDKLLNGRVVNPAFHAILSEFKKNEGPVATPLFK